MLGFFSNETVTPENSDVVLEVGIVEGYLGVPVNLSFNTTSGTAQGN